MDRRGAVPERLLEQGAADRERFTSQVVVAEREEVEGHQRCRGRLGQHRHS